MYNILLTYIFVLPPQATLESAFQLIFQLYILATEYTDLQQVSEVTLWDILNPSSSGSNTRFAKQVKK